MTAHAKQQTATQWLLPALALIGLLLLVAWMAGLFTEKVAPGKQAPPAPIVTATQLPVQRVTVPLLEPVPATVRAKEATEISARLLARIERIHVRAGDEVQAGQVLIELEQSDLNARLEQARQQVAAIEARVREAEKQRERIQQMYDKGLVAAAELDQVLADYNAISAQLAQARQARREAATALSFSQITAPIAGRVIDRFAEPGDTAAPGQKLLSLYNPLSLRVEGQVREQLALALTLGQSVTVNIPSLEKTVDGTVEELVPAANPGARTFLIKVAIQLDQRLLPGMFARLLIPAGEQQVLAIDRRAVASIGQLDVVWVLDKGELARRYVKLGKPLPPGAEAGERITVLAGLDAGDVLVPAAVARQR